jgi:hypothetical protein
MSSKAYVYHFVCVDIFILNYDAYVVHMYDVLIGKCYSRMFSIDGLSNEFHMHDDLKIFRSNKFDTIIISHIELTRTIQNAEVR